MPYSLILSIAHSIHHSLKGRGELQMCDANTSLANNLFLNQAIYYDKDKECIQLVDEAGEVIDSYSLKKVVPYRLLIFVNMEVACFEQRIFYIRFAPYMQNLFFKISDYNKIIKLNYFIFNQTALALPYLGLFIMSWNNETHIYDVRNQGKLIKTLDYQCSLDICVGKDSIITFNKLQPGPAKIVKLARDAEPREVIKGTDKAFEVKRGEFIVLIPPVSKTITLRRQILQELTQLPKVLTEIIYDYAYQEAF